jgi:hypothetical protein
MKRFEVCLDLPENVKDPIRYLERKLHNSNVVFLKEIQTIESMDKYLDIAKQKDEINICEICGKEYVTYPIILSNNPLSICEPPINELTGIRLQARTGLPHGHPCF